MNRSDFFKKLGLGVIAVAVAPKILAEGKPITKGRKLIDNFINANGEYCGKYMVMNISNSDLCEIEDATFEFIKKEYWPIPLQNTCEHLLHYRGKDIYLCVDNDM